MELRYRNSFFRDLDNISNRALGRTIENLIQKIEIADSPIGVPRLKRLKWTREYECKIELQVQTKTYWILADIHGKQLQFVRIKSEAWCKANL
jgi:hypothetical protein